MSRLPSLIGVEPSKWMMSPSERLAILGILLVLKPESALELGCAEGGLTRWLSEYCKHVVTVDLDPKVLMITKAFSNVTALCMTTESAAHQLEADHKKFDLTIIDADHSKEGVYRDLRNALRFSDIIVLHDTYYPPCREGILDALSGQNVYYDLELVPGGFQPDGLWGGLGIVIPSLPHQINLHTPARLSAYAEWRSLWRRREYVRAAKRSLTSLRKDLGRLKKSLANSR